MIDGDVEIVRLLIVKGFMIQFLIEKLRSVLANIFQKVNRFIHNVTDKVLHLINPLIRT